MPASGRVEPASAGEVPLRTIVREWARIGCTGFGGPPSHIALLRRLCVEQRGWMSARHFEDGIAATNLLPGPASTQLAIFCAWTLRGATGAILGGLCFIVPGLVLILALATVFLGAAPPQWILGAAAGAGAAVPAVALRASSTLVPSSWRALGAHGPRQARWVVYALTGVVAAAVAGPYLVVVLLACGAVEVLVRRAPGPAATGSTLLLAPAVVRHALAIGGLGTLAWVALKVGALSFGGGFVIVPLMQHDAVSTFHWMTAAQFLDAVALGQVTPGPVVQTVAVVGYAAGGIGGGLLAALVAFAPSFAFVIAGAPHFDRLRANHGAQAFLAGAGPAVIGAIAGSAIPLGLAVGKAWQVPVLAASAVWLLALRRSVVVALLAAGLVGATVALSGVSP